MIDTLSVVTRRYFDALPGAGAWLADSGRVVSGEAGTERLGTHVRFHLKVAGGRVEEARFQAYGCPHTLAIASWLTERLPGRDRESLIPGRPEEWLAVFAAPVEKLGRLLIVEDALISCKLAAWPSI